MMLPVKIFLKGSRKHVDAVSSERQKLHDVYSQLIKLLKLKFSSGNAIPVERITITRDELPESIKERINE